MFLMYVDESGDPGLINSNSKYFVLSGLVLHELRWQVFLDQIIQFRQRMKASFSLKLREEIHAARLVNHPGDLIRIARNDRLTIIRDFTNELATLSDLNVINVIVDKQGKPPSCNVFEMAWMALIQRFENTMSHRNFRGPVNSDDRGMIITDHTDVKQLTQILRKMRRYNPLSHHPFYGTSGSGYRNLVIGKIIEDPTFRDSQNSYFIQAADLCAFLLYQKFAPNIYIRKKGAGNYFDRLMPILCQVASSSNPMGIVTL